MQPSNPSALGKTYKIEKHVHQFLHTSQAPSLPTAIDPQNQSKMDRYPKKYSYRTMATPLLGYPPRIGQRERFWR